MKQSFVGSKHALVLEDVISHFEQHEMNAYGDVSEYYERYGDIWKAYDSLITTIVQLRSYLHEREKLIRVLVDVLVEACGSRKGLYITINTKGKHAYEQAVSLLDDLHVWYSIRKDDEGNTEVTLDEEDKHDD